MYFYNLKASGNISTTQNDASHTAASTFLTTSWGWNGVFIGQNCYSTCSLTSVGSCCGFTSAWYNDSNHWVHGNIKNCYFAGTLNGGHDYYFGNNSYKGTANGFTEMENNYYKQGCIARGTAETNTSLNSYISSFSNLTSLPEGFSTSDWTLVNGLPELNIFIK